ncbi:hypothetical protein M885DRAFT_557844 [Pelagophyceae sp. CCMP2097]|nr:hypothetical protein M885DRAFT_557844 [Pelagophyceae sp. CCMP2097]
MSTKPDVDAWINASIRDDVRGRREGPKTELSQGNIDSMLSFSDWRVEINATGRNSYFWPPTVVGYETLVRSSCTCSGLSPGRANVLVTMDDHIKEEAAAADDYSAVMHQIRAEICRVFELPPGTGVITAPSGTDAEYAALTLVRMLHPKSERIRTVITCVNETGKGCVAAAMGKPHSPVTPLSAAPAEPAWTFDDFLECTQLPARDRDGVNVDAMATVHELAAASSAPLVVHVVHGSKCNRVEPWRTLASEAPDAYILVDACQTRMPNAELGDMLRGDAMVMITGSKFYQGPPFSGALLVPPSMMAIVSRLSEETVRESMAPLLGNYFVADDFPAELPHCRAALPATANTGSALRWLCALTEARAYADSAAPDARAALVERWRLRMVELCAEFEGISMFEASESIVNLKLTVPGGRSLKPAELRKLFEWLTTDMAGDVSALLPDAKLSDERLAALRTPCMIGQPVDVCADFGIVRLALGSVDIRLCVAPGASTDAFEKLVITDKTIMTKIDILTRYFDQLDGAKKDSLRRMYCRAPTH